MATYELYFTNSQLGNFNTSGFTGGLFGSQNLTINFSHPGGRLVSAGAISHTSQITGWRLTVEGDMEPGDNDVVPFAPMTIEYSTDGGLTWLSYSVGIGQPTAVWYARQDEEGWMAIVADVPGQPDGQMGFIVADAGVTPGQVFTTDETVLEGQTGEYALPCFKAGTLIDTEFGERRIETLRPGDLVWTLDCGLLPLAWIARRSVPLSHMVANPKLRPIRFAKGSLGAGLPRRDLLVSRQHRMLIQNLEPLASVNAEEALVAAHHLTVLPGVEEILPTEPVTYVHLLFSRHQVIRAEGALSESLFLGYEALKLLDAEILEEISNLFPHLLDRPPVPARPIPLRGRDARTIACGLASTQPLHFRTRASESNAVRDGHVQAGTAQTTGSQAARRIATRLEAS